MKQYLKLLKNIINNGIEKESGRANMPNTIGISHATVKMNMFNGFPLLTTKKMFFTGIVHELLWFIRGDTNIKYLVDNGVNIWNQDAYRWYLKQAADLGVTPGIKSIEIFILEIKIHADLNFNWFSNGYRLGDLGKVYGEQWRNQNGIDQLKDVYDGLNSNPYSRYHIIDAWNKADFPLMALPPCHLLYQFIVRPLNLNDRRFTYLSDCNSDKSSCLLSSEELDDLLVPKFMLDLNMYQRSCDTFLGVPFNLASMSLLLLIMAKACKMKPGIAVWTGGDTHLYVDHIKLAKEQLTRQPSKLPVVNITKQINCFDDLLSLSVNDFKLLGYDAQPSIKAELFTGIKK